MERVLIIGPCGAGKSTLSFALAEATGLPLVHLDKEYWQPGWIEMEEGPWQGRVDELIAAPRWIIEGNYGSSLPRRLGRADTVIFLDLPTHLCLWRALKRIARYRGVTRPDMAPDCPERFDAEFLLYVATFRHRVRPRVLKALADYRGTLVRLTRPAQVHAFLEQAGARAA